MSMDCGVIGGAVAGVVGSLIGAVSFASSAASAQDIVVTMRLMPSSRWLVGAGPKNTFVLAISGDGRAVLSCDGVPFMPDGSYEGAVPAALAQSIVGRVESLPPVCRGLFDCLLNEGFFVTSSTGEIHNACPPNITAYEIGDLYLAAEAVIRETDWLLTGPTSQSRPLQPLIPLPSSRGISDSRYGAME